jgi:uncharacterized membrane protein
MATAPRRLAVWRLAVGSAAGAVAIAVAVGLGTGWAVALSLGWCALALVVVLGTWGRLGMKSAAETKAHARQEDLTRGMSDTVLLGASVASLIAVAFTLAQAGERHGATKAELIALAFSTVVLAWLTVHTLYALRYGDLYYGDPVGGIDFNEDDPPDYRDFAYLALTIGMTYQVSDTNLKTKTLRRTAIRHALLSFAFGAIIVAVLINVVASLLSK